jgi:hypothetical protein
MGGAAPVPQETALEKLNRKRKADLQGAMGTGGKILGGLIGGFIGSNAGPAGIAKGASMGMVAGETLGSFGGGLL